ncbi:MAG: type II secretion system F family protein [Propionibacteriaceae bacterium]|jgi:tight adherence protein B|nr:type II secretion system F family protein [Propionibacteriaceae bacterium]
MFAAVVFAGLAAYLRVRPASSSRLRPVPQLSRRRLRRLGVVAGSGVALFASARCIGWPLSLCAAIIVAMAQWQVRRALRQRSAKRARQSVLAVCRELAGQVAVGLLPQAALQAVAEHEEMLRLAAAAAQVGGQVSAALRETAQQAGLPHLNELAEAWEVSVRTGASMTATLASLSRRLERERELGEQVEAELSAARATSKTLAFLPLAGIGLGMMLGGDPLGFLFGSLFGQMALLGGVAAGAAGMLWVERISNVRC